MHRQTTRHGSGGVLAANRELRLEFARMGLEVREILDPIRGDPDRECRVLEELLRWARAYRECPDRRRLEERGFRFPPIEPDTDPDTDWVRFERWMQGKPTRWNFCERYGWPPAEPDLNEMEVDAWLLAIVQRLAEHSVFVEISDAVPARAVYRYLRRLLAGTRFEYLAPGAATVITGCDGDCADCFQRPWCSLEEDG